METKEITPAVEYLRKNGYKVSVTHSRYWAIHGSSVQHELTQERVVRQNGFGHFLKGKGGRTDILITTPDGKDLRGWSQCSVHDNFNRKVGTRIALERAFENDSNSDQEKKLAALLTDLEKLSFELSESSIRAFGSGENTKGFAHAEARRKIQELVEKYK